MAAPTSKTSFTIGTRKSKLALEQTELVCAALKNSHPNYEFKIFSKETAGDLNTTIALKDFASKNLWTEELEELMIAGQVDLIVHSLKGRRSVSYLKWRGQTQIAHMMFYYARRCPHPPPRYLHLGPDDAPRR